MNMEVSDPLFRRISARYLILPEGIALVEMAQASGLELLTPTERNPMNTSTFGTGEMIIDALDRGCNDIVVSVGGSATNDLGMGAISALGGQFVDSSGIALAPIGGNLRKVSKLNLSNIDHRIAKAKFSVITDVHNSLFGSQGAAHIFAAQKGANRVEIALLDQGLRHVSSIIGRELSMDIAEIPGSGAAGGLAGGCVAFLNADIRSGFDVIADMIDLHSKIQSADIIITGEGHLDGQTISGKVISGIGRMAQRYDKQVVAFCGKRSITSDEATDMGIDQIIQISDVKSEDDLHRALTQTVDNLKLKAKEWIDGTIRTVQ